MKHHFQLQCYETKNKLQGKKKLQKNTNLWRLNNMLLNNQWFNEKIKEEIRNYLRQMKTET